jgi:hypothetical protein
VVVSAGHHTSVGTVGPELARVIEELTA